MDLDAIRELKAQEEKDLLTHRQPGLNAGEDFKVTQIETNRRRFDEDGNLIPEEEAGPVFPEPDAPATSTPPADLGPDRWHKKSLSHITVSKQDFGDPILQASRFDNIPEAYNYAETTVLPKLGSRERVVIEVHGGEYDEPLDMTVGRVDLHGIGKPTINNILTVFPQCSTAYIRNFKIRTGEAVNDTAVSISPILAGLDTGSVLPPLVFEDCTIECTAQVADALFTQRRALFFNCTFISYGQQVSPVRVSFMPTFDGYADFYGCRFIGFQSGGRPRSYGLIASAKTGGTYYSNTQTATSGVRLFDCESFGTIRNEGWMLAGDRSKIHAGVMSPTGNFNVGLMGVSYSDMLDPLASVSSRTQWDGGRITSSHIFQATDDAMANGTGLNQFYGRDLMHLLPGWVLSGNTAFPQVAAPFVGSCNVDIVETASHCNAWSVPPVNVNAVASTNAIAVTTMIDISIP